MRILASGVLCNRMSGQDRFLFSMNEKMQSCDFDYFVPGESCIHEDAIVGAGGKIQLIRSMRKHPIGYLVDVFRVLKENEKNHIICYLNLSKTSHIK